MHEAQKMVSEFHKALGIPDRTECCGPAIRIRRAALRAELIREEAAETVDAIENRLLVPAIDGLCDLLVVTYGAACEFGIDLEPYFREVHLSNMAKQGGPVRGDGKVLKPEGWLPPDILGVLQTGRGRYS